MSHLENPKPRNLSSCPQCYSRLILYNINFEEVVFLCKRCLFPLDSADLSEYIFPSSSIQVIPKFPKSQDIDLGEMHNLPFDLMTAKTTDHDDAMHFLPPIPLHSSPATNTANIDTTTTSLFQLPPPLFSSPTIADDSATKTTNSNDIDELHNLLLNNHSHENIPGLENVNSSEDLLRVINML